MSCTAEQFAKVMRDNGFSNAFLIFQEIPSEIKGQLSIFNWAYVYDNSKDSSQQQEASESLRTLDGNSDIWLSLLLTSYSEFVKKIASLKLVQLAKKPKDICGPFMNLHLDIHQIALDKLSQMQGSSSEWEEAFPQSINVQLIELIVERLAKFNLDFNDWKNIYQRHSSEITFRSAMNCASLFSEWGWVFSIAIHIKCPEFIKFAGRAFDEMDKLAKSSADFISLYRAAGCLKCAEKAREIEEKIKTMHGSIEDWINLGNGMLRNHYLFETVVAGIENTAQTSEHWIILFCKLRMDDPRREGFLRKAFEASKTMPEFLNCFHRADGNLKEEIRQKVRELAIKEA